MSEPLYCDICGSYIEDLEELPNTATCLCILCANKASFDEIDEPARIP